ncbi:MAG: hypothetical protein DA328_02100 [Nitrososphaeraceae archaeon]|nr:hypothetical protein [Nitrososphaeraceae archaeon]
MPSRKPRWTKPGKRMSKKQLLIPPIIIGASTLFGFIVMQITPPPKVLDVCLKAHDVDTFNIYPRVHIFIDSVQKYLPSDVGKNIKDGKQCLHVIHTDEIGDTLHVEYIRPVRVTMDDFLKLYSLNNTITVIENSTGMINKEIHNLTNYDVTYSYFSEGDQFINVSNLTQMPPFSSTMLVKMDMHSRGNFSQ